MAVPRTSVEKLSAIYVAFTPYGMPYRKPKVINKYKILSGVLKKIMIGKNTALAIVPNTKTARRLNLSAR
ncbi:hypothetical protein D3C73_1394130 [compost metagenome]